VLSDPFVGRHVEQDVLRRAVDGASAGRGSIVLIAGEPGIGKSSLARVASEHAESAGMTIRRGACWEEPSAPFWPWVQVLRVGLDHAAPAAVRGLAAGTPGDSHVSLGGDAEPVRLALFDVVSRYLAEQASRTPMLIVFEDLHWADVPSLRLLGYLARTVPDASLTVVGTFRDVEIDRGSEIGRALEAVSGAADVVKLSGLQTGEVAELLAATAGELAPTEFAREMHARTGGNPLFVRELSRLLAAPGRSPADIASLPIPDGVHGVIRRRVARLSQPTQELLSIAAVFGAEFRADLAARAAGRTTELALDVLDSAVEGRLVVVADSAAGLYAFTHALVRDVLYESIPASRRAVAHLRVADAIESSGPIDDHLAELAFHHLHGSVASDVTEGIRYSVLAGRRALEQLAYEDASSHFVRALAAMEGSADDDQRAELLLELGDARLRAGDMPGARAVFEDAAALARKRGRPEDLARAALGFGAGLAGFEIQLFDERQIGLIEEALKALPPPDSALRAALLARLSVSLTQQESVERRRAVAEEAVAMSRRVGDDRVLAYALSAHCDAIAAPADCMRRLDEAGEIVRIGRGIGDRGLELLGRRFRLVALLEMGDIHAVDVEIEQYAAVADVLRQPLYSWYVPLWHGMRALMRGDLTNAFARAEEAEALGARAHSVNARMLVHVLRWYAHIHQGRFVEAHAEAHMLSDLMPGWGNPYFELFDSWVFPLAGDLERGRAAFRRMPDPFGDWIEEDAEWMPSMCQVAFAVALLDEHDVAAAVYERLLPHRARFGVEGIGATCHGSVEHHLGLLARTAGDVDTAVEHFEAALDANRRIGARVLEPSTLAELASTLLLRDSEGDAQRAAELRSRSAVIRHELGLQTDAAAAVTEHAKGDANVFRREGELWTLSFAGEVVRMKDVKGARDIASLLGRPGAEVAALDLATERGASIRRDVEGLGAPGHAGEVLDDQARDRYKARLAELEDDIRDADALGDPVRAERAHEERDAIVKELSAAYGLGGRARRAGDPSERARTTVTRRIREAIARIEDIHPALGRHLRNSVRTGTFCSYVPEHPVDWAL
jgi:tetratricopeptide (TPR) repeat protein